jgi:hypothetical protein
MLDFYFYFYFSTLIMFRAVQTWNRDVFFFNQEIELYNW